MNDLDEARADLHALIRQAHEATKDLQRASKDLDTRLARAGELLEVFDQTMNGFEHKVAQVAELQVQGVVDVAITPVIDDLLVGITTQMELVREAIYARMEVFADDLLGEKSKIAWNELPLPDYLDTLRVDRPKEET